MSVPVSPVDIPEQAGAAATGFPMRQSEFIVMMAMLMALQALAIDAMLPALGNIATDLGVSDPNRRQLVVGLFLLASGLAALLPGSLADRFGRRWHHYPAAERRDPAAAEAVLR